MQRPIMSPLCSDCGAAARSTASADFEGRVLCLECWFKAWKKRSKQRAEEAKRRSDQSVDAADGLGTSNLASPGPSSTIT
jgi:hypothetical protein